MKSKTVKNKYSPFPLFIDDGFTKSLTSRKDFQEYSITNEDLVLEIASNDGYLLQYFKSSGIKVLGVEPAKSVADVALSKGIETISEFFGTELALELRAKGISPKIIVANNVSDKVVKYPISALGCRPNI